MKTYLPERSLYISPYFLELFQILPTTDLLRLQCPLLK